MPLLSGTFGYGVFGEGSFGGVLVTPPTPPGGSLTPPVSTLPPGTFGYGLFGDGPFGGAFPTYTPPTSPSPSPQRVVYSRTHPRIRVTRPVERLVVRNVHTADEKRQRIAKRPWER